MHSPYKYDLQAAAGEASNEGAIDSELNTLREVLRMLPHGVTVQDEHGQLLLANDAAMAQLGIGAAEVSSKELEQRREAAKVAGAVEKVGVAGVGMAGARKPALKQWGSG